MFAILRLIGFRRFIALWLLRRAWRIYLARRTTRTRTRWGF